MSHHESMVEIFLIPVGIYQNVPLLAPQAISLTDLHRQGDMPGELLNKQEASSHLPVGSGYLYLRAPNEILASP